MDDLVVELEFYEEQARNMRGWQFEYEPEIIGEAMPWDYEARAGELIRQANSVLDLGTGGGEVFSRLLASFNGDAYALEQWLPNVPVAADRLAGAASVVSGSSLRLPFDSRSFDLVLARHEAIDPVEVAGVLRSGGRFFSQQVVHDFMHELKAVFPETVVFPDFFNSYKQSFLTLGFEIQRAEEFRHQLCFRELGRLVYQLVASPWTVPEFSVATHLEGLRALDKKLKSDGVLLFSAGYYLLEATKGADS